MKRILVIGCPGSGKSTFARKLQEKTNLPLCHLDMLYHLADRTTVPKEVFDRRLTAVLETEKWIIDGNYSRTLPLRLQYADTVFLFDLPTEDCICGVEARIGKPREDMPWQETEFDPEFKKYIRSFRKTKLPKLRSLLDDTAGRVSLTVFHSRKEADDFLCSFPLSAN